jgi:hypothetical protein
VLACYLDDSDATTSKVSTIAGYVAHEDGWQRFEQMADEICGRYNVDLIRGRQIDGRMDCFAGWSLLKTEGFLDEIGRALPGNILFGISRSIGKDNWKLRRRQLMALDSLHKRTFSSLSAFGFCFASIAIDLKDNDDFEVASEVQSNGIAYMIESGSKNNPDIHRYVDAQRKKGSLHVNTIVTEVDKRSCRAIQVADLYAFYSRRRMNKFSRFKGKLEFVPDIHKIHVQPRIKHDMGFIEEPFIQGTNTRTGETFNFTGIVSREGHA